jgi:serine/threonine protein kinase/ATP/maltotriose-dependent transcriptional regulator MalT
MDIIGQVVGQYRIVEPIGQGGMATVFKAYQSTLERFVALKVVPNRHVLADGFAERFLREARAIAQLNHPNILPILEFGQESEFSYIVTKLVTGGTLKDRLEQPLELSKAVQIIEQIAAALDHAHERGILHRDVKPSNVLLDEDDWVQLADFGLAKMMAGDERLTDSGVGIGTPAYMSPEQGQGLRVDHRADIYSLGAILYETVTGRLPYTAETPMAIIFKHIYEPLTLPRLVRPEIPPLVEAVILKALEKRPENRYDSASDLGQALREAVVISEAGADIVVKSFTVPVDETPSQPTLSLEGEPAAEASPSLKASPTDRTPLPEVTPPPEGSHAPEVEGFVGREAELAYFDEKLKTLHLGVITGMPGVGKTTFAARLVQQAAEPETTFWHSFHESEGVEVMIWRLAGFLYWRGHKDLWSMLQGAQQSGGQPPPTEVLLDYLMQMISGQDYLICLDDLNLVHDDSLVMQLVERLYRAAGAEALSLVVISRRIPEFVPTAEFEPLPGLSALDTGALLAAHGLSLPDRFADELYAQTEGNAQLLILAIDALKRTQNPRLVIDNLAETDDIERYLINEVDASLSEHEREVMSALSVLLGHPARRDAIEAIRDNGSVQRMLGDLNRRHLLSALPSESGKQYFQHATVRAFYYGLLGRAEREEMHLRAGEYYEAEEPDTLKAAVHFERAGEHERSARLVTGDIWAFINQGQVQPLRRLLEQFTGDDVDAEPWTAVNIARGQVYSLQREGQLARDSYEEALASLTALPESSRARELNACACRGMGELLEYEAPQEALEWLHRGLGVLARASIEEEAALYMKIGSVHIGMGNYVAAANALDRALELVPAGYNWIRAGALTNLATVHFYQGDSERATACTLEALEISQHLNDFYQMLLLQSNIGIDKQIAGDWIGAATDYQQALALAEQLGSVSEQTRIESNLGLLYTNRGDDKLATAHLTQALELARAHDLKEQLTHILSNLADVHLRQGEPDAAKPLLAEAERLALELDSKYQLPEVYRGWARVQLANGQPGAALMNAERSVNMARDLGLGLEEGVSLRILGQVLIASEQATPGMGALEQSLSLLTDDAYEAARTKTEWGRHLISDTDVDLGKSLLNEARETFQELGAKRDLDLVTEILVNQAG